MTEPKEHPQNETCKKNFEVLFGGFIPRWVLVGLIAIVGGTAGFLGNGYLNLTTESTRRAAMLETQAKNIEDLTADVKMLDRSVQTLVDSGSPQLKVMSEKLDAIDKRLIKVELLLAPRPGASAKNDGPLTAGP